MKPKQVTTDFEYETARLNALIAVIAKTGWTIKPYRLRHWRATIETTGYIIGLEDLGELTLFATDGVLGLFQRKATGRCDTYHTHRPANAVNLAQEKLFTGKITPLVQKPKKQFHDQDADGNPVLRTGKTKVRVKKSSPLKQKRIDILNSL